MTKDKDLFEQLFDLANYKIRDYKGYNYSVTVQNIFKSVAKHLNRFSSGKDNIGEKRKFDDCVEYNDVYTEFYLLTKEKSFLDHCYGLILKNKKDYPNTEKDDLVRIMNCITSKSIPNNEGKASYLYLRLRNRMCKSYSYDDDVYIYNYDESDDLDDEDNSNYDKRKSIINKANYSNAYTPSVEASLFKIEDKQDEAYFNIISSIKDNILTEIQYDYLTNYLASGIYIRTAELLNRDETTVKKSVKVSLEKISKNKEIMLKLSCLSCGLKFQEGDDLLMLKLTIDKLNSIIKSLLNEQDLYLYGESKYNYFEKEINFHQNQINILKSLYLDDKINKSDDDLKMFNNVKTA